MRRRLHLTFPRSLQEEPLVYTVGQRFGVVTNITRASIEDAGWMILVMDGEESAVSEAVAWLAEQGVQVSRLDDEEP